MGMEPKIFSTYIHPRIFMENSSVHQDDMNHF